MGFEPMSLRVLDRISNLWATEDLLASKGHFLQVGLVNCITQSCSPSQATHLGLTASRSHIVCNKCLAYEKASNQPTYATDISIIKEIKGDVKNGLRDCVMRFASPTQKKWPLLTNESSVAQRLEHLI